MRQKYKEEEIGDIMTAYFFDEPIKNGLKIKEIVKCCNGGIETVKDAS